MRAGVRQAALEHGHPAEVRSTSNLTRAQRFERFTLDRLLARTAGYEIRLARDAAGSTLAAKCTRADAAPAFGDALRREHGVLSRLCVPSVVATAGLVETSTGPVLLLEYLGGGDLVSLRGFAARHWLGAARDVAAGLGALHASGLAHRDVKARNVRFAADGRACLIDLGSAAAIGSRATAAGTTAAHVRPGASARPRVAAADDVHAFAVLLYELMTGRLPYGATPAAAAARPVPPAGPERLAPLVALVMRVLDGDDGIGIERFERVIDSLLDGEAVPA